LAAAEKFIYTDPADPLVNWDEAALTAELAAAGLENIRVHRTVATRPQRIPPAQLERWFADTPGSYAARLQTAGLTPEELREYRTALSAALAGKDVAWTITTVFVTATVPKNVPATRKPRSPKPRKKS